MPRGRPKKGVAKNKVVVKEEPDPSPEKEAVQDTAKVFLPAEESAAEGAEQDEASLAVEQLLKEAREKMEMEKTLEAEAEGTDCAELDETAADPEKSMQKLYTANKNKLGEFEFACNLCPGLFTKARPPGLPQALLA